MTDRMLLGDVISLKPHIAGNIPIGVPSMKTLIQNTLSQAARPYVTGEKERDPTLIPNSLP